MTHFEIKYFCKRDKCFRVDVFNKHDVAKHYFEKASDEADRFQKKYSDDPHISKFIAFEIQFLERDDEIDFLAEVNRWSADKLFPEVARKGE
jgi:hypothetical protein